jgi:hypothetical protein
LRLLDLSQDCALPDATWGNSIRRVPMMDAIMMAIAFAFFALSIAYAYACDRL